MQRPRRDRRSSCCRSRTAAREEDAFFVEGIHDDLLTLLAQVGDQRPARALKAEGVKFERQDVPGAHFADTAPRKR